MQLLLISIVVETYSFVHVLYPGKMVCVMMVMKYAKPAGILFILIVLSFASVTSVSASTDEGSLLIGPLVFEMETAVDYALEHNPGYQRAVLAMRLAELDFDFNSSIFEPTLNADINASHTRTGSLSYESEEQSVTDMSKYDGEVSLSKLLPAGDAFNLSFGGERTGNNSSYLGEGINSTHSYTSALGFTYTRPLQKGFGSYVTTAGIRKAEIDIAISEAAVDAAHAELIYAVRLAYLRIAAAREAVIVAEASLNVAESLYEETKAFVDAGALASYQEIAAEAGLFSRREELLSARGEYEKSVNGFKEILGIDFAEDIGIASGLDVSMPEVNLDTAIDEALGRRPDLMELRYRRHRAEIDLKVARNSMRPELGFTGGFGLQGADFDYAGSIGGMDNFSWFAGLTYRIPIGGNQAAKAQAEMAMIAIDDIGLMIQSREDSIRREVLDALVDLDNTRERLVVAEAGLEAAVVKVESERKRFELGLITAGDLLEYESEYTSARFNVIRARIEYLRAGASIAKLTNIG